MCARPQRTDSVRNRPQTAFPFGTLSPLVHHLCSQFCTFREVWGTPLFPDISRQLGFLGFPYLWEINWVWIFASLVILNSYSDSLVNAQILGLLQKWLVPLLFFLIYGEKLLLGFKCWHIAGLCSEEDCWIRSFWECRFWSTWSPVVLREKEKGRCLLEWQDGFQAFNRLVTESYFNHSFIFLYPTLLPASCFDAQVL